MCCELQRYPRSGVVNRWLTLDRFLHELPDPAQELAAVVVERLLEQVEVGIGHGSTRHAPFLTSGAGQETVHHPREPADRDGTDLSGCRHTPARAPGTVRRTSP